MGRSHACACIVLAACIGDPTVHCGDVECPAGAVCVPGGCATPEQLAACVGHVDGDACMTATFATGTCVGGACQPLDCGDGKVVPPEVCDDRNQRSGDGCSADCLSTEVCGNGYVDPLNGEQCDGGIVGLSRTGCTSLCTAELDAWVDTRPLPLAPRYQSAMTYDTHRHRTVLWGGFGNGGYVDTTTWDGQTLRQPTLDATPPFMNDPKIAFDAGRGVAVLFGGDAETWEWDGIVWTKRTPAHSPPPLDGPGLAYDPIAHDIVLFGGYSAQDTWTWDGIDWNLRGVASAPPAGRAHLAYDGTSARVIAVVDATYETWAWSAGTWTRVATAAQGPGTHFIEGISEAQGGHVLLFGGENASSDLNETWEWNGSTWSKRLPTNAPAPREGPGMAFDSDRGRVVLFGGATTGMFYGDLWEWTGSNWVLQQPASLSVSTATAAFLPQLGSVVVGPSNTDTKTALWDGFGWSVQQLAPAPSARTAYGFATAHDHLVLFGGTGSSGPLGDTWLFDGAWHAMTPAHKPTARGGPSLAYDPLRDRMVLFGGAGTDETWEWDGTDWAQASPAQKPPATTTTGMAYDPMRQRIVLYAGYALWDWDGVEWTREPIVPPAFNYDALAYEPQRRRLVLAGTVMTADLVQTWECTVQACTQLHPVTGVDLGPSFALMYNGARGELYAYSIAGIQAAHRFFSQSVPADRCIDSDTDGDGLVGCADPDCWGRCTPFCPPGTTCDPSAPHCGDGTCSSLEDYRLCPTDCSGP